MPGVWALGMVGVKWKRWRDTDPREHNGALKVLLKVLVMGESTLGKEVLGKVIGDHLHVWC